MTQIMQGGQNSRSNKHTPDRTNKQCALRNYIILLCIAGPDDSFLHSVAHKVKVNDPNHLQCLTLIRLGLSSIWYKTGLRAWTLDQTIKQTSDIWEIIQSYCAL